MVKLQRSPKNPELDINVAKNGQFRVFPRQMAYFTAWRSMKVRMPQNTTGPGGDDMGPPIE